MLGWIVARNVLVVHRHDHPMCHSARVADMLERFFQIPLVRIRVFYVLAAKPELYVIVRPVRKTSEMNLRVCIRWYGTTACMTAVLRRLANKTHRISKLPHCLEGRLVNTMLNEVAQKISSRPPLHVTSLLPGLSPWE